MKQRKYYFGWSFVLTLSIGLCACASNPTKVAESKDPKAKEDGYYVSIDEAKKRGGVAGFVFRSDKDKTFADKKEVASTDKTDEVQTSAAATERDTGSRAEGIVMGSPAASNEVAEETVEPEMIQASLDRLSQILLFEVDQAELRSQAKPELSRLAGLLAKAPDQKIKILGYADATGPEPYNDQLSQRRADAVRSFLTANGASQDQVGDVVALGERNPVASNDTAQGRAKNRRVEIQLTG